MLPFLAVLLFLDFLLASYLLRVSLGIPLCLTVSVSC